MSNRPCSDALSFGECLSALRAARVPDDVIALSLGVGSRALLAITRDGARPSSQTLVAMSRVFPKLMARYVH